MLLCSSFMQYELCYYTLLKDFFMQFFKKLSIPSSFSSSRVLPTQRCVSPLPYSLKKKQKTTEKQRKKLKKDQNI